MLEVNPLDVARGNVEAARQAFRDEIDAAIQRVRLAIGGATAGLDPNERENVFPTEAALDLRAAIDAITAAIEFTPRTAGRSARSAAPEPPTPAREARVSR